MFKLNYTIPKPFVGTIRYKPDQYPKHLGLYTDADGKQWDIIGLFGSGLDGGWCQATPYNTLHPYYSSTDGSHYGYVSQTWNPYKLECAL